MVIDSIDYAARRARAAAFVRQILKPGRAWATLNYDYQDTPADAPEKEREHDHAERNDRQTN